jgi:hypothetical protein
MVKTAMIAFLMVSTSTVAIRAEDFRVETTVKEGRREFTFLTLFRGTTVYDFQLPGGEISIFDMARKQVMLVNPDRKLKTLVTFSDLSDFAEALQRRADERDEGGFFDRNIKYQLNKDAELPHQVATTVLGYVAKAVTPPSRDLSGRYHRFADAATLLAGFKPGGLPPYVRMRLNLELSEVGQVPVKVRRTIQRTNLLKNNRQVVTAKHEYNWLLSKTDQTRIAEANTLLARFKTAQWEVYMKISPRVAEAPGEPATQQE